ncbi:DUF4142 domain-containing protein [Flavobacterium sp. LaA7.5]|nr:DUF4142 domain-containing protein [Flavobacterium salilacus subsp. altitudinum]
MSLGNVSCKNDKKDTEEVAEEQNEEKFDDNKDMEDDSEYLVHAAEVDMKEIELGKMAQQKATNAGIKEYGKMMVEQHTKASEKTKDLAQSMNVTLPMAITEDGKEAWEDLNDETGMDFDKKYINMMVDGHEKTIKMMEEASEEAQSEKIRRWASDMLPTHREHLQKAKTLKEEMDNM